MVTTESSLYVEFRIYRNGNGVKESGNEGKKRSETTDRRKMNIVISMYSKRGKNERGVG